MSNNNETVTIHVKGESFTLNEKQLDEVGRRLNQKITTGGVIVPKLKSYIDRIERLEEDKAGIGSDIKDVFGEAKSSGFDVKAMRSVLKLRKLAANEHTEQQYMLDLYMRALGMAGDMDEDVS